MNRRRFLLSTAAIPLAAIPPVVHPDVPSANGMPMYGASLPCGTRELPAAIHALDGLATPIGPAIRLHMCWLAEWDDADTTTSHERYRIELEHQILLAERLRQMMGGSA